MGIVIQRQLASYLSSYYPEVKLEDALPSCLFVSMAAIRCASSQGLLSSHWRVLAGHWEHPMA